MLPKSPTPFPLPLILSALYFITACTSSPTVTAVSLHPSQTPTLISLPTSTHTPTLPSTRTPSPLPTHTPLAPMLKACSPLHDVAGADLAGVVVNPFHPPRFGSDDPHQGVDLAQRLDGDSIALSGSPVQALLPGTVAAVIAGRFPYGNALMVETPLEDFPDVWLEERIPPLPTLASTLASPISLTCPEGVDTVEMDAGGRGRSIYILYAHLQEPPTLKVGHSIGCGDALGAIGDSGNALNPHLHVEVRLGPAEARFPGLAHYDTSASPEEMANYCLWRVSGIFQLVDPMPLLALVE